MDDLFDDFRNWADELEERPMSARLLVGTVGATALMMVAALLWAITDASRWALVIAAAGITIASFLIVLTALPLDCKIGPMHSRSLSCRLQSQRRLVDAIATVVAVLVIANILTTTI
jgi:hypothetical protein